MHKFILSVIFFFNYKMELLTKKAIRLNLKKIRLENQPSIKEAANATLKSSIVARVLQITQSKPAIVAGYYPIQSEFSVLPALSMLQASGYTTALPIAVKKRTPLLFRQWTTNDKMETDIYKTPIPSKAMPYVTPDILLIPMLGFTESGYRIGYGGGFYDITILELQ
jgi:5,10-methenyltetrahydrofolate synthetase